MSQTYQEKLAQRGKQATKGKSKEEFYKKKFKGKSKSTIEGSKSVISNFEVFAEKEGFDIDELFTSIAIADKESKEAQLIQLCNDFIEYLQADSRTCSGCRGEKINCISCGNTKKRQNGISASSMKIYVNHLTKYFDYRGFPEAKSKMFFAELDMPIDTEEEELAPMTPEMFKELVEACTQPEKRLNLKFLRTNLCRPQEMIQLKKSDLVLIDTDGNEMEMPKKPSDIKNNPDFRKIMTKFRGTTTKNKKARVSWVSDQIVDDVLKRLDEIDSDELVFTDISDKHKAKAREVGFFQRIRPRLAKKNPKWLERYVNDKGQQGGYKYKLYSLRSMGVTDCSQVDNSGNFGHYLAGHSKYMGQYIRETTKKKLELYNKAEEFMKYDKTPKGIESELAELRKDNIKLEDELFLEREQHKAEIRKILEDSKTQRQEDFIEMQIKFAESQISKKKSK